MNRMFKEFVEQSDYFKNSKEYFNKRGYALKVSETDSVYLLGKMPLTWDSWVELFTIEECKNYINNVEDNVGK